MKFTYDAYIGLLHLLREKGYVFTNYFSYEKEKKCVILRHDIDFSLDDAVRLSEIEKNAWAGGGGVYSTWFVLF